MKFQHLHIKNFLQFVPNWAGDVFSLARNIDQLFGTNEAKKLMREQLVGHPPKFWIEADLLAGNIRIATPSNDEDVLLCDQLIITTASVIGHASAQIIVPLTPLMQGCYSIADKYVIYLHSFQTETPLGYIGVSKRMWYARFAQHVSSAKCGSPYLFHRAIRNHCDVDICHKVLVCDITHDMAMSLEEEFVGQVSLYPLGLNMIPGGNAGIKYLHKLGIIARNANDRDKAVEDLSARDTLAGQPNPLCAARWASDADFVERVICGHSGRLTADQVRTIRLHSSFGLGASKIKDLVGARNERQVLGVISERYYSRIAGCIA